MRVLFSIVIIAGIIFLVVSLFPDLFDFKKPSLPVITLKGERLFVEIADTPEERFQGLSGRSSMPSNRAMLFVFEDPGLHSFVMRDMYFGLDFLWIDENWEIVRIDVNIPENYSDTLRSTQLIQYVLELNAGWARDHNVVIGDRVDPTLLNL